MKTFDHSEIKPCQLNIWDFKFISNTQYTAMIQCEGMEIGDRIIHNRFVGGSNSAHLVEITKSPRPSNVGGEWVFFTGVFEIAEREGLEIKEYLRQQGTTCK